MSHSTAIDTLLSTTPRLWRGHEPNRSQRTWATGHNRLDSHLPGSGWPIGAVTELITAQAGLGEFSLLFPVLSEVSNTGQWLILVDPPWIPYPAALHGHGVALERLLLIRTGCAKESLWACEQALHGSQGGVVLAWPELIGAALTGMALNAPKLTGPKLTKPGLTRPGPVSFARLRRLQLAAEAGSKLAFLFRPEQALASASPCALRLHLHGEERGTRIDILKCRGQRPSEPVWIPRSHANHSSGNSNWPDEDRGDIPALPAGSPILLPASATLN